MNQDFYKRINDAKKLYVAEQMKKNANDHDGVTDNLPDKKIQNDMCCLNCKLTDGITIEKILVRSESGGLYMCKRCGNCGNIITKSDLPDHNELANEKQKYSFKKIKIKHLRETLNQFQCKESTEFVINHLKKTSKKLESILSTSREDSATKLVNSLKTNEPHYDSNNPTRYTQQQLNNFWNPISDEFKNDSDNSDSGDERPKPMKKKKDIKI